MGGLSVVLILLVQLFYGSSKKIGYQWPQIQVVDGHLIVATYAGKSIKFVTDPTASFMINDIDVLPALQKANKASQLGGFYQNSYMALTNRVNTLEQRMVYVLGFPNTTVDTGIQTISFRRLSRRVTALQRTVNDLRGLLEKDECTSSPCRNGGVCQDMFNNYICRCPDGWEGPDCSVDVNECAKFAGTDLGCQNGATCVNKQGTYECLCQSGYMGIHCTRKSADCATGGTELCGHGICIPQNTALGYKCYCDQGWTTDASGRCMTDVDECSQNHPSCSTNPRVTCINVPGSFYCGTCPQGYIGNGYYCDDINECETLNGHCSMNPLVACINTPGSRICGACPPGYFGDGVICSFRGVCNVDNGGCHHMAQCRDNPRISATYVECICPAGYVGNGIGPNGCVLSSNQLNSCSPNPCYYGTCSINNVTKEYVCSCRGRYTGRNCDIIKQDPCASNPCLNGATCQSVLDVTFKCLCPKMYSGKRCELEAQGCGGLLQDFNGTLKYPPGDYAEYDNDLSCAWVIKTVSTHVLNITFKNFDIEASPGCRHDWLQLHDGANSGARGLGRFCGTKFPLGGNIVSTHNSFYLWLRSNGKRGNGGFELTWTSITPECGKSINNSHGSIESPGSPGDYPPNRDCYWSLQAPVNKRILFHFYLLNIGDNSDCDHDYLEFYSGTIDKVNVIFGKFCNSSTPSPFYSVGPTTIIHFHSDAKDSYPGFQLTYSVVEGIPGCGGTYTTNSGIIQSIEPSLENPEDTDNNICEYKIIRPPNTKVKITILILDLPYSPGCRTEYLEVHEGPNVDSPLIERYCGTELPAITTVGNQLTLLSSVRHGQWKLKYESVCEYKFTERSGEFKSPNQSKSDCIYKIERPPGYRIELVLKIPTEGSCIFGFVQVRDGHNENSTLIGTYCLNRTELITSTHNYLWIHYVQRDSFFSHIKRILFEASYTSTDTGCGGILRDKTGNIASPTHPDEQYYPGNLKCSWVIIAPSGYLIQLSWRTFNVEPSRECRYDSVQVFDNNTELGTGDLMGKFCGLSLPPLLQTISNIMTIVFTTDITIHMDGFSASYVMIPESRICGGKYFTSAGVIKTPKFPNEYPSNRECIWTITVNPNQQILLNVTDFDLEYSDGCRYDFLEIRNGATAASPLVDRYCGPKKNMLIPSHANQMYLSFKSDMSRGGKGFRITWSVTSTGCGGTLTSPKGSITSPQYPEPYYRNTECIWRIIVNAGSRIQMVFSDIDLQKDSQCTAEYVQIFDGLTTNTNSVGKFCSGGGSAILSTGNQVLIKFRSDVLSPSRGFQLHYSTQCHNTLTGFRGVIESPNFPNFYSEEQDCLWDIIVSERNKINITFSHFSIDRVANSVNSSCPFDYIEIKYLEFPYDEYSESEPGYISEGKYCDANIPKPISLNSDHAQVHFVSSRAATSTRFRLEWQLFGCGGILTRSSGKIESPNYPQAYPPSIKCQWSIQLDFAHSIQIHFDEVNIERDPVCDYDAITIYNGPDNSSNVLTKICHQKKPVTLTSTGNFMYIEFRADSSYQGKGFSANYSAIPAQCGGHFTAATGNIFTRNYPKNYEINDTCVWLIEVDETHSIDLDFEDIDLIKTQNCEQNYVKIHDGPTAAYPVLERLCGTVKPNSTIHSTFNEMYIEFRAHKYFSTKGFLAKYRKSCGSRITTQGSGIIEINHHEFTEEYTTCTWTIVSTDPSRHVSLTITHTESQSFYCDDDNDLVQIFGGESTDSPLIKKFCGTKVPPPIISDGSAITILLKAETDFSATYSVLDSHCGGTYTSSEGYFATPGYPRQYASNMQCEWIMQVAPGNHLTLSFIEFDLIPSDNCNTDYLEIRRNNASGQLLGSYCGKNAPENITNEGPLWMLYKGSKLDSDTTVQAKGFYGEYSLNHNNDLTGPKGIIASPMYPKEYSNSGTFSWKITVAVTKKILLTFKEFAVESDVDDECYSASLDIYDGVDETANQLKSLCGLSIPDPISSSSNIMFISASYNFARMGTKFLLEWLEVSSTATPSSTKVDGCGTQFIDINSLGNFVISSPGYPEGYKPNLNCEWIFSTIPMNHLNFYFTDIDLQNDQCVTDYIAIYQKHPYDNDWQLVNTLCKKDSALVKFASTNLMKMNFVTNSYRNGSGFKANVYESCGGSMSGSSGYIVYNLTTQNAECQWNITVRSGRTINLSFLELNIPESKDDNCKDYIMVRNGKFSDSPILGRGKYCGTTLPETLHSTANHLYIKYTGTTKNVKFKLKYQEISFACGREIVLSDFDRSVEITSPNYPNIPYPHSECTWLIRAPPAESIRIDFEDRFDLSVSKDCSIEYVELRDGSTEYSPLIGKYCTTTTPNSQFSTGNVLFVKFFTDTDEPKNGFKANISLAYCGGTVRGYTGKIIPPVNRNYIKNINCTWKIVGPVDHYLTLEFERIKTANMLPICLNTSKITVTEPESYKYTTPFQSSLKRNVKPLKTYCGKVDTLEPFNTSSNVAIVNLVGTHDDTFILTFNASQTACGGTLVQEQGTIKSPGYPGMNHGYRQCLWVIKVPEGRRVKLNILDLDLGVSSDSYSSGIVIYDGETYMITLAYLKAGSSKGVFESSSNIMSVRYWSTEHFYHRGFKAMFTSNNPTICESDFTADKGVLTQPTPKNNSYWCQWVHNNKNMYLNQTLALTISYNTNITFSYCQTNSWIIRVTSHDDKVVISKLCQVNEKNRIIRSPFHSTKLEAVARKRYELNFTASYSVHDCGGIFKREQGVISSPNFPNKPSKSVECAWLLKGDEEQAVNVTVSAMDLDNDCEKNFLAIYNGDLPTHPRIGKYCHNNKPNNFISQSNSLWIEYKWETGSTGTGFKLQYEAVEQGCGGIYHDKSRIIQTPNYGKEYPNNAECLWEIHSNVGYTIRLEFIGRFYIEDSQDCKNDYLEILDWKYDAWVSLGKKCGRNTPEIIQSTGDKLRLLFRTNKDIPATGFKAKWDWRCGGTFEASKTPHYILSPGYPEAYTENLNCVYNITSKAEVLNIKFEDFETESEGLSGCRFDNVTITGRFFSPYPKTSQTYCGKNTPQFIRVKGNIAIIFKTDSYINKRGFKFVYNDETKETLVRISKGMLKLDLDATDTGCGGEITKEEVIEYQKPSGYSPSGFYSYYYPRIRCFWKVTAPPKQVVILKLYALDISATSWCMDQVKLYSSIDEQSNSTLAIFCGYIKELNPIVSETGKMLVKLDANAMMFQNFKAEVHFSHGPAEGCGGIINLTETKILQSPNLANLDCNWKIIAPRDFQVEIHFTELNLPERCVRNNNVTYQGYKCSFIEISDGTYPATNLITQLYSHFITSRNFTTLSNSAFIRFILMNNNPNTFKAILTPVLSKCGPSVLNVTKEIKTITTPNYPNKYPEGIKCSWAFEVPNQPYVGRIVLHFVDFDLLEDSLEDLEGPHDAEANYCNGDVVEIIEDPNKLVIPNGLSSTTVYQGQRKRINMLYNNYLVRPVFCGKSESPFDFYGSGKSLTLTFKSIKSHLIKGKGFKLEYSLAGCNRNYTSLQGRISNGNDKSNCVITITVPENHTISLYFLQLYIPYSINCSKAVFEVRDGSSTGRELMKTCGYRMGNPVFSYTNKLYIYIKVNENDMPFIIRYDFLYTSTEKGRGCGGELYNYKGKFSSPLYPNQYRNDSICTWKIRVPRQHQVALKFTNFDIQGQCETTYVKVTTYFDRKAKSQTFCQGDNPAILRSDYYMDVEYSSSLHNGGTGWMAVFQGIQDDDTDVF